MTETKTTTMMTMTATTTAAMTAANWAEKFLCLNRISKEIRIKIEIKSIYNEATHSLSIYFIKKEINEQKATTDRFRLQFVHNKSFVVQQTHKIYFVICIHNLSAFTQWSYSNRIICSALKTVHIIFFDLIFFFYTYQERSFFFLLLLFN